MDDYPLLGSTLDIYAGNTTIPDSMTGVSLWVDSEDRVLREILMDLYHNRLHVEDDLYGVARMLCKYGTMYAEALIDTDGVVGLNYLPPPSIRRVEDGNHNLLGYAQDVRGRFNFSGVDIQDQFKKTFETGDRKGLTRQDGMVLFEPWEMVCWRTRGKSLVSPYGQGVLDNARWIWRRLIVAEDTALIYKVTRAPARYAFYVDVGDLPPAQAQAYVQDVRRAYKKKRIVNQSTGKLDFRVNPMSYDDDFWIPTRGGQESSRIDVISGPDYQAVEDLQYWRENLLSAVKVPARYVGIGGETNRASLSQEDVQFARQAMRIQRDIRNGYKQFGRMHLAALGIDPDNCAKWDVTMSTPSQLFELAQIEVRNAQADLASRLTEWMPKPWVMQHVFRFTSDEANQIGVMKKDEDRRVAFSNAETQADIVKEFPELGPQGAMGASEMASVESKQIDTDMLLAKLSTRKPELSKHTQMLDSVLQRLDEMAPMVKDTNKAVRRNEAKRK